MTLTEFQDLYKDIRDAIVTVITSAVDTDETAVWNRDAFDPDELQWTGNITGPDGTIHCWTVHYTGTAMLEDEDEPVATNIFAPTFRIIGYRAHRFGTDADNSSDKHLDELNAIRFALRETPTLGLPDVVESHNGFLDQTVMAKIDTKPVHLSRIDMAVQLHPIPYDYPA